MLIQAINQDSNTLNDTVLYNNNNKDCLSSVVMVKRHRKNSKDWIVVLHFILIESFKP